MQFGTKAETLRRVSRRIRQARVPDFEYFPVQRWHANPQRVLDRLDARFGATRLAVRSSALAEDTANGSGAGAFHTSLDVDGGDAQAVSRSIELVIASMPEGGANQVLVQHMLQDVALSGVIMTYDLIHGAPYYVVEFDDESGRTDAVTSGTGRHKSLRIYRGADAQFIQSPRVARFLALAKELEKLCGGVPLDIEFAMTASGELYLFQVRRISTAGGWHPVTERRVSRQLAFVENIVREWSAPREGLYGRRTILAMMSDWNPAEIIGSTPRPLAASLYRKLVTRGVWREARRYMGYRALPPTELMVLINHHPYVDVRASFNSFLPAGLDAETGAAVVDLWLDRLDAHPELHDKVEFQVAQTCRDFAFDAAARESFNGAFSANRLRHFKRELTALTARNLDLSIDATLGAALQAIADLERAQEQRAKALVEKSASGERLSFAARLLEQCEQVGTFAFAVIARHAFIAEALLRSAAFRGALAPERIETFKQSITTVTSGMVREYDAVCRGKLTRAAFMNRYGHLRPGTYDITSLRYDERHDLFLDSVAKPMALRPPTFALTPTERRAIERLLHEAGYDKLDAKDLLEYARRSIAGREHAKFVFTRDLSGALARLVSWGELQGLSRDDLSFLDWSEIDQTLARPVIDYADRHFLTLADAGRRSYAEAHAFRLAHIVRAVRDIYVATLHRSEPNFVGTGSVTGRTAQLDVHSPATANLSGCIVCIENADPGFDWIFTKGIAALVTKFGGANSHMAIRCAELNLPAAIGCGEQSYLRLVGAGSIEVNCPQRIVRPVRVA